MSDRREHSHRWFYEFDSRSMTIRLREEDEDAIPARFDVCPTCDGKGSHVNPSIDSQGLTREDFDEDPGFAEDYFSGVYDVACAQCGGTRVVPVIDTERASAAEQQRAAEAEESYYADLREQAYERRMGF